MLSLLVQGFARNLHDLVGKIFSCQMFDQLFENDLG